MMIKKGDEMEFKDLTFREKVEEVLCCAAFAVFMIAVCFI